MMISGASKVAKSTSTDTSCEFCRQMTTTSAIRIAVIQRRQLVCFFSWGPMAQILDVSGGGRGLNPVRDLLRIPPVTRITTPPRTFRPTPGDKHDQAHPSRNG